MNGRRTTYRVLLRAAAVLTAAATAAAGEPLEVVVKTVHSASLSGRLVSFSLERGLVLERAEGQAAVRIKAEDVIRISTVAGRAMTSVNGGPEKWSRSGRTYAVTLGGRGRSPGDRLIGVPQAFSEERVVLSVESVGTVFVPLEMIAHWRNLEFGWGGRTAPLRSRLGLELVAPSADELLLTNGDRVRGIVTAVDGEGFVVELRSGASTRIRHARVVEAAIVIAPLEAPKALHARVELIDGTRLTSRELEWGDDGGLRIADWGLGNGEWDTGSRPVVHEIAAESVVSVEIVGGRWRWLTELEPISVEQTAMMSVHWPYQIDCNALGGRLRSGGETFGRGIGVHSRSSLTFDLGGEYREFVTQYGMDDASGPLADVRVAIRVDGELRHERASVVRGTPVRAIRIDVSGARRMELLVDFGRFGGIQDRFDWLESGLVR